MNSSQASDRTEGSGSDAVTFRVYGRAYPERDSWWFDPIELQIADAEGFRFRVSAKMAASQFSGTLTVRRNDELAQDALTAKNVLEDIIRTVLDTIGLYRGAAVDCETIQVEQPDGETLVLDSAFGDLQMEYEAADFHRTATAARLGSAITSRPFATWLNRVEPATTGGRSQQREGIADQGTRTAPSDQLWAVCWASFAPLDRR